MKKVLNFTAGDRIDRYLTGKLSPDEQARFEEALLSDPEMQRELESAMRLRDGLRKLAATEGLGGQRLGSGRWGPSHWMARAAGIAALVLVPVLVIWVASDLSTRQTGGASAGYSDSYRPATGEQANPVASLVSAIAQPKVTLIELFPLRGAADPAEAQTLASNAWLVLSLTVSDISFQRYQASVEDSQGASVWQDDQLQTDEADAILLGLRGDLLPEGTYSVKVIGISDSGSTHPAGFYQFYYPGPEANSGPQATEATEAQ